MSSSAVAHDTFSAKGHALTVTNSASYPSWNAKMSISLAMYWTIIPESRAVAGKPSDAAVNFNLYSLELDMK